MTSRIFIALGLAIAVCSSPAGAQDEGASAPASSNYKFRLRTGQEFTGFMTESTTVNMLVAGLELKVPVPLVDEITFNNTDRTRIRMSLNNGDSLTGQIMPSQLGVMAEWGTLKINSQSLSQVKRVPAPPRPQSNMSGAESASATETESESESVPASPATGS